MLKWRVGIKKTNELLRKLINAARRRQSRLFLKPDFEMGNRKRTSLKCTLKQRPDRILYSKNKT